ncbi:MAG: hypothetical protein RIE73_02180 [Coleofasciculus sp. C1-SOL-03]
MMPNYLLLLQCPDIVSGNGVRSLNWLGIGMPHFLRSDCSAIAPGQDALN